MENENINSCLSKLAAASSVDTCEMKDAAIKAAHAATGASSKGNSRKTKKFSRIRMSGDLVQRLRGFTDDEDAVEWGLSGWSVVTPLAEVHTPRNKTGAYTLPQVSDVFDNTRHKASNLRGSESLFLSGGTSEDEGISDLALSPSHSKRLFEGCDKYQDERSSLTSLQWGFDGYPEKVTQDGSRCSSGEAAAPPNLEMSFPSDVEENEEEPTSSSSLASSDSGAGVSPDFVTQEEAIRAVTHCFSWLEDELFALEPQTDLAQAEASTCSVQDLATANQTHECDECSTAWDGGAVEDRMSDDVDEWEIDEDFEFTSFSSVEILQGELKRDEQVMGENCNDSINECFDWSEEHYTDESYMSDDTQTPEEINGSNVCDMSWVWGADDTGTYNKEESGRKWHMRPQSHGNEDGDDMKEELTAVDQARRISAGLLVCDQDRSNVTDCWRILQVVNDTPRAHIQATGNKNYKCELRNREATTNVGKKFSGEYVENSGEALENAEDGSQGSLSESEWSDADTCILKESYAHSHSDPATGESDMDEASTTSSSEETASDTQEKFTSPVRDITWQGYGWSRVMDSNKSIPDVYTPPVDVQESWCSRRSDVGSSTALLGHMPAPLQTSISGDNSSDTSCQRYCNPALDTRVPHLPGKCLGCLVERDRHQQVIWKPAENYRDRPGDRCGQSFYHEDGRWLYRDNRRWYRVGNTTLHAKHNGHQHMDNVKLWVTGGNERRCIEKFGAHNETSGFGEKETTRCQDSDSSHDLPPNDSEFCDGYHDTRPHFTTDNYQPSTECQAFPSGETPWYYVGRNLIRPGDTCIRNGTESGKMCPSDTENYHSNISDCNYGDRSDLNNEFCEESANDFGFREINLNSTCCQNVTRETEIDFDVGKASDTDAILASQTRVSLDFFPQYQEKHERREQRRLANSNKHSDFTHAEDNTSDANMTSSYLANKQMSYKQVKNKTHKGKTYLYLRPLNDMEDEENRPGTNKISQQWSVREQLEVNGRQHPGSGVFTSADGGHHNTPSLSNTSPPTHTPSKTFSQSVSTGRLTDIHSNLINGYLYGTQRCNEPSMHIRNEKNIGEKATLYNNSFADNRCTGWESQFRGNSRFSMAYGSANICKGNIRNIVSNGLCEGNVLEGANNEVLDDLSNETVRNAVCCIGNDCRCFRNSPSDRISIFPQNNAIRCPGVGGGSRGVTDSQYHHDYGSESHHYHTIPGPDNYTRYSHSTFTSDPSLFHPSVEFHPPVKTTHGAKVNHDAGHYTDTRVTCYNAAATAWERSRDKFWKAVKFGYPSGDEQETDNTDVKTTSSNMYFDKRSVLNSGEVSSHSTSSLQRRLSIPASCLSHSLCARNPLYRKIQEALCSNTKIHTSTASHTAPDTPVLTQPTSVLKGDLADDGSQVEGHWQSEFTTYNRRVIDRRSEPQLPQETKVEASVGDGRGSDEAAHWSISTFSRNGVPAPSYTSTGLAQREPPDGTATPSAPVGKLLHKLSEIMPFNTHTKEEDGYSCREAVYSDAREKSLSFEDTTLRSTCKDLWDPGPFDSTSKESHFLCDTQTVFRSNTPVRPTVHKFLPLVTTLQPKPQGTLSSVTTEQVNSLSLKPQPNYYPFTLKPQEYTHSPNPNIIRPIHGEYVNSSLCVTKVSSPSSLLQKTHDLPTDLSEYNNPHPFCRTPEIPSYPSKLLASSSSTFHKLKTNSLALVQELPENGSIEERLENSEPRADLSFLFHESDEHDLSSPNQELHEDLSFLPKPASNSTFTCIQNSLDKYTCTSESQDLTPTQLSKDSLPVPELVDNQSYTLKSVELSCSQEPQETHLIPLVPEPLSATSPETTQMTRSSSRPLKPFVPEATSQQSSIFLAVEQASERCSSLVDLMKLGSYEGYITLPMTFKSSDKSTTGLSSKEIEGSSESEVTEKREEKSNQEDEVKVSTQVRVSVEKCCKRRKDGSKKIVIKFTLCLECAGCKEELVEGQALIALDQQWHIWCFKCAICSTVLHGEYMGKDGLPYCEKDYQAQFGVKCAYCNRFISGKVLQAGDNHHFHPTCARCTKCGDPFGDGEEMYLQGTAIWHPRCGPGPTENGTVLNGSLANGHHINGEQKTERDRDFDGMSSTASETQFSRSRTPSLNGSFRSYSPYNSLNRKFSGPYRTCSPGLILREYKSSQSPIDITRIYTYSYLAAEPSQGYLKRPLDPYDRPPPKSPHFHRPPMDSRKLSLPKTSSRLGMRVLVDQMQAETPRPKSPHMNNEEPIILSHYPGGRKPSSGDVSRIERDDFPAPPYPYTDPERRRRWSGSNKAVSIDETDEGTEIDEDSVAEDPKLKREEVELSKIATGIGKVFLQQVKEREKIRAWKATHLDPRNASRTPAADREPGNKLRFGSSLNASPSRMTDHSRPWGPEDDEFDRGSSYRCSTGRSSATIPSYNVVSSLRQPPKPGYGFSPRNTFYRQGLGSYSALHGDYSFSGLGEKTQSTEFSSARSDVSAGSLTEADRSALNAELCASATYSSGLRGYSSYSPHLRRSLPNMHHMSSEPPKIYPAHLLLVTNYRLPNDVDRCHLERHLSDTDFEMVFHMTRMDFYRLPEWRRNDLKRRSKLF
ncbi:uncharacterized protein [Cherax quadricarinatus]|uniref:uncharacterized protein isoform X3 n=1 Tax=Cherax quadricarinatus TaxID=27406 RepID=UPI00387EDC97